MPKREKQKINFLKVLMLFVFITAYSLSFDKLRILRRRILSPSTRFTRSERMVSLSNQSKVEVQLTAYSLFAQDKIVAVVNNEVITQKDLNDFINFMRVQVVGENGREFSVAKIESMKLDLLDKLIEDRLILQEAKKNNLKIDENRVKARVEEIKRRYPSDIEFQRALAQQGLVQADIEQRIREQLLMYSMIDIKIRSKITINPAEVTDFYQKNIAQFKKSEQRDFDSIALEDGLLAKEIFQKIQDGGDLKDLAKEYSLSLNKLTVMQNGQLEKQIEEVVFKLKLNEVSEPIKIKGKHYIFKLNEITPARQENLSEVKDRIYHYLFNYKMQEEFNSWIVDLKNRSYIKLYNE